MGLELKINKREKLSDQLYGQLLEKIINGQLAEGEKLPSENEIAKAFSVSRPVIREALLRLQADGLVRSRQGVGSFVLARPPEGLIKFAAPSDVAELLRCFEARMPIEGAAAALAAQRATHDDLKVMKAALVEFERAIQDKGLADKVDFDFHVAVIKASGNDFFITILQSLNEAIRSGMRVALNITKSGSIDRKAKILEEHRAIYNAISAGDPVAADLAMRYHIQGAKTRITDHQRDK